MHEMLNGLHSLFAVLGLVTTIAWGALALTRNRPGALGGATRGLYVGAMATTGLSGITGLVVTFLGPWVTMAFPWIGLVIVGIHGFAGKRAKQSVMTGGRPVVLIVLQVAVLLAAGFIMAKKPF